MASESTRLLPDRREVRFPRFRLTVTEGPDRGRVHEGAAQEVAIGTADANDLVLTDPSVSRHHVAIAPTPRGLLVRDLGSTNGTVVGAVPVEAAYLVPHSVLALGNTRIEVSPLDGEESPPLSPDAGFGRALGKSAAMRRLFAMLPKLAASDATVLFEGETGTGKTLLAHSLHEASARAQGPFVVVDCGSIPPNLIESELFGHEKGAFTGATAARIGALEAASTGTVFLDEIGELPLDLQPKLLRALDERVVKRVGSNAEIALDARVIAATNRDLRSEVNRGQFRMDLYYRLNTFRLRVPPLRERREDIPLLVAELYSHYSRSADAPPAELIVELTKHDWPGNVRELRAAVERTVLLGDPRVWREFDDLRSGEPVPEPTPAAVTGADAPSFRIAKERAVAEWERGYITQLVRAHGNNLSKAARAVCMDRNHLRELLIRHRVRADE